MWVRQIFTLSVTIITIEYELHKQNLIQHNITFKNNNKLCNQFFIYLLNLNRNHSNYLNTLINRNFLLKKHFYFLDSVIKFLQKYIAFFLKRQNHTLLDNFTSYYTYRKYWLFNP